MASAGPHRAAPATHASRRDRTVPRTRPPRRPGCAQGRGRARRKAACAGLSRAHAVVRSNPRANPSRDVDDGWSPDASMDGSENEEAAHRERQEADDHEQEGDSYVAREVVRFAGDPRTEDE